MKKLLSLTIAVALLLTIAACSAQPTAIPNPALVLGEKYLTDLDYEQALLQFDQAIEIEPKNPRGYLGKADALLHLERQAEAVDALSNGAKAVQRDQREIMQTVQVEVESAPVDGYIGIAAAYEALSLSDIALAMLQRVAQEFPTVQKILQALLALGNRLGLNIELPNTPLEDVTRGEQFSFRGHIYAFFSEDMGSWEAAQEYCEGLGGHLAVITSQELNDYIYSAMRSLGMDNAYFGYTDREEEGVWRWVNGVQSSYVNWHEGEPNDEHEGEDYAMFFWAFEDSSWNDGDFELHTGGEKNFICEWDSTIM